MNAKSTEKKKVLQSEIALEKCCDFHEKHEIFNLFWIAMKTLVRQAMRLSIVVLKNH